MGYPWTLSIVVAILVYGMIAFLFTQKGKWYFTNFMLGNFRCMVLVPTLLFGLYLAYVNGAGGVEQNATVVCYYIFLPCVILSARPENETGKISWDNALTILFLWLPFDLHLLGRRQGQIRDALDWPLLALSGVIIALLYWGCLRDLKGMKTVFRFRMRDLLLVFFALFALTVILVPFGYVIGFLKPLEFLNSQTGATAVASAAYSHLATKKFLVYLLKIFVTIGISEEMLFRGVLQNLLDRTFSSKWVSLAVASLLFGAAHLNNGAKGISPELWNWKYFMMASVCGTAYGLVFRYTTSILFSVLLHSLVDSIWHTLF